MVIFCILFALKQRKITENNTPVIKLFCVIRHSFFFQYKTKTNFCYRIFDSSERFTLLKLQKNIYSNELINVVELTQFNPAD